MFDSAIRRRVEAAALAKIRELHRATTMSVVVSAELLQAWIDTPLSVVRQTVAACRHARELIAALDRLAIELCNGLEGRSVTASGQSCQIE